MSYTDRKITQAEINAHHVQGATDYLIGNPQQNKAVFDNLPEFIAGKFNDLIDEIAGQHGDEIRAAVDEWLAEHPEVTTTVQDNSLTTAKYVDGSVTPAKLDRTYATPSDLSEVNANLTNEINVLDARMDEFASLPEGSTTADAELLDIRVGADGTTYSTAGDSVRGQVADLKSDLSGFINIEVPLSWTVGKNFVDTTGAVQNNSWCSIMNLPLDNMVDLITFADTTGGHLWYNIQAFDDEWAYQGEWNASTNAFVKSEVQIRATSFYVATLKKKYPTYHFYLKIVKDNGGMAQEHTACFKGYAISKDIISNTAGSIISWQAGQYKANNGQHETHVNAICSIDFVPDYVKGMKSIPNGRVQAWTQDGTYAGVFYYTSLDTNYNTTYSNIWDFEAIRSLLPNCKLRITVYDVNSNPTAAADFIFYQDDLEYLEKEVGEKSDSCDYAVPTSYSLTSIYQQSRETNHRWQGFGTDGTYLYVAELTDSTAEETAETIIHKIDPTDGTLKASSSGLVLGHANSIGYDPIHGYLLVAYTLPSNPYLLFRINASDLSLVDSIDLTSLLQATGSGDTNPSGIAYISEINGFLIYTSSHYVVVDANFQTVIRTIKTIKPTSYLGQSTFIKGDMIVQVYAENVNWHNMIVTWDWHGNNLNTVDTGNSQGELQGIAYIGDTPYFCYEASTCAIYRADVTAYNYVSPMALMKKFNLNY